MLTYCPFYYPANADRRYFPLGTSDAKPAVESSWRSNDDKFQAALLRMLGSPEKVAEYMRFRNVGPKRYGWKT